MRRRYLAFLTLLPFLLAACGGTRTIDHEQVSSRERIVVKFSHVVAENTPKGQAARLFATLVKQRTHGRVEVQVFPNSMLYGDSDEMDALKKNEVQFIAPSISKLGDIEPLWQVFDLPYLFDDTASVRRLIAGSVGQRLYADLRKQSIEPLAFWENGFKVVTNAQRPLIWPADAHGLRFRIQPSDVTRDAFNAIGADASVQSFDSLYGVLANQEVDAQENTPSNIVSKRVYDMQSYLTVTNHGYLGYIVMTNEKFWKSLSPDLRTTIVEAMQDATQWVQENAATLNNEAMDRIKNSGKVVIHEQTPGERVAWRDAMRPAYQKAEQRLGVDNVLTAVKEAQGK